MEQIDPEMARDRQIEETLNDITLLDGIEVFDHPVSDLSGSGIGGLARDFEDREDNDSHIALKLLASGGGGE